MSEIIQPIIQFTNKDRDRLVFSTYKGLFSISLFGKEKGRPPFSKTLGYTETLMFKEALSSIGGMASSTCKKFKVIKTYDKSMTTEGALVVGKDDEGAYIGLKFSLNGSDRTVKFSTFMGGKMQPSDEQFDRVAATMTGVRALVYLIDHLLLCKFSLGGRDDLNVIFDGYNNRFNIAFFKGGVNVFGKNLSMSMSDMFIVTEVLKQLPSIPHDTQKSIKIFTYNEGNFEVTGTLCVGRTEAGIAFIEVQEGTVQRVLFNDVLALQEDGVEAYSEQERSKKHELALGHWIDHSLPNKILTTGIPFSQLKKNTETGSTSEESSDVF